MSESDMEAAVALMGRRVWGLFIIMITVMGLLVSIVPGCGLAGVVMCIAALILVLLVPPGGTDD
jgi:hypothetical protein